MTPAPYIIVTGTSLQCLQIEVQLKIKDGYQPTGGPFNAGPFHPPHGGLAQAMVFPGPLTLASMSTAAAAVIENKKGKR
jgi:hypothetical protein